MRTKKTKTKTSQKAKPLAKVKLFYSEKNFWFWCNYLVSSDKIISDYSSAAKTFKDLVWNYLKNLNLKVDKNWRKYWRFYTESIRKSPKYRRKDIKKYWKRKFFYQLCSRHWYWTATNIFKPLESFLRFRQEFWNNLNGTMY